MMRKLIEEQIKELMPLIKGRVISLIGDRTPDWEDLTQDIMLSMAKAEKLFRHDADIKTLLYVVTMRRYYDYLREKYKEKAINRYMEFVITAKKSRSPRRMRGPETRIDNINFLLKTVKLTDKDRGLLEAVKKTILSGRLF